MAANGRANGLHHPGVQVAGELGGRIEIVITETNPDQHITSLRPALPRPSQLIERRLKAAPGKIGRRRNWKAYESGRQSPLAVVECHHYGADAKHYIPIQA